MPYACPGKVFWEKAWLWSESRQGKGKGTVNKQTVGTHGETESTALGRRGSGRALSGGRLLQGRRCPRRFLGNTVSPHAWGGVSPSRTVPGFSWFALLSSSRGHSPDHPQMRLASTRPERFLPSGPSPVQCCRPDVPFLLSVLRPLAYLLAMLKSLSSGFPSSKNPSMTHTPTHSPARMRCPSSKLISVDPLIPYYNSPNKYLLSVCLVRAGL